MGIRVVEDMGVADTILDVGYTFAWDYPFKLIHQNSTVMLIGGKGYSPFSGPVGAVSVAAEFVKLMKPHRAAAVERKQ